MYKKLKLALLAIVCLASSGCGFNWQWLMHASSDYSGEEVSKPAGKVIEASIGKEFVIVLESNRTTGYQWQLVQPLDKNIVLVKSVYQPKKSNLAGSGGKEIWTFKAIACAEANITFRYVRPWEKDVTGADKKTFAVTIK